MTAFVYVNTSKQIGHKDHVRVFANVDAAEKWFEENDPEGAPRSSTRCWNKSPRLSDPRGSAARACSTASAR